MVSAVKRKRESSTPKTSQKKLWSFIGVICKMTFWQSILTWKGQINKKKKSYIKKGQVAGITLCTHEQRKNKLLYQSSIVSWKKKHEKPGNGYT